MTEKRKRMNMRQTEPIAREATRAALRDHEWITPEQEKHLTLGTLVGETHYEFELYLAGARPQDAVVLTRASVDRLTGEVEVEVFLPQKAAPGGR